LRGIFVFIDDGCQYSLQGLKWSVHERYAASSTMKTLLLLAVLCTLCGCQTSAPQPRTPAPQVGTSAPQPGAGLSQAQAVAIARQSATEQNVDLGNYQQQVHVDFIPWLFGDVGWRVLWANSDSSKIFQVVVDCKTGKVVSSGEVTRNPGPPPN
jgi:hypothetical protein